MRRRLYTALALAAFADSPAPAAAPLSFALLAASILFAFYKLFRPLFEDDADASHIFKVTALTLILWLVPLYLVARLYLPSDYTCMTGEVDADEAPRIAHEGVPAAAPLKYEDAAACAPGASPDQRRPHLPPRALTARARRPR